MCGVEANLRKRVLCRLAASALAIRMCGVQANQWKPMRTIIFGLPARILVLERSQHISHNDSLRLHRDFCATATMHPTTTGSSAATSRVPSPVGGSAAASRGTPTRQTSDGARRAATTPLATSLPTSALEDDHRQGAAASAPLHSPAGDGAQLWREPTSTPRARVGHPPQHAFRSRVQVSSLSHGTR
jgi:hypothetical protein